MIRRSNNDKIVPQLKNVLYVIDEGGLKTCRMIFFSFKIGTSVSRRRVKLQKFQDPSVSWRQSFKWIAVRVYRIGLLLSYE